MDMHGCLNLAAHVKQRLPLGKKVVKQNYFLRNTAPQFRRVGTSTHEKIPFRPTSKTLTKQKCFSGI